MVRRHKCRLQLIIILFFIKVLLLRLLGGQSHQQLPCFLLGENQLRPPFHGFGFVLLEELLAPPVLDPRFPALGAVIDSDWLTLSNQIKRLPSVGELSHTESSGEFEVLKQAATFFGFGAVIGFANWLMDSCLSSLDPFLGSPSETSLSLANSLITSLAPPAIALSSFLIEFRS